MSRLAHVTDVSEVHACQISRSTKLQTRQSPDPILLTSTRMISLTPPEAVREKACRPRFACGMRHITSSS